MHAIRFLKLKEQNGTKIHPSRMKLTAARKEGALGGFNRLKTWLGLKLDTHVETEFCLSRAFQVSTSPCKNVRSPFSKLGPGQRAARQATASIGVFFLLLYLRRRDLWIHGCGE